MIANEVVHGLKTGRMEGLMLKLDFEKAFDSISRSSLFQSLHRMKFRERWIKWLQNIITTSRISVLVNGSPTKEFSSGRGLRQWDPLSPLLFLIAGEVLHCMLKSATLSHIFEGVDYDRNGNSISHLQFADDTLLFIKNDLKSVTGVKQVLQCFELLSGLKINYAKSSLYGLKNNQDEVTVWANKLGCKVGTLPIKYLSMNLGSNPGRRVFWQPLISRMKDKLASWKSKTLNQAP